MSKQSKLLTPEEFWHLLPEGLPSHQQGRLYEPYAQLYAEVEKLQQEHDTHYDGCHAGYEQQLAEKDAELAKVKAELKAHIDHCHTENLRLHEALTAANALIERAKELLRWGVYSPIDDIEYKRWLADATKEEK